MYRLESQWVRNRHVIDELEANESVVVNTSDDEASDNDVVDSEMDVEPQDANGIKWRNLSNLSDGVSEKSCNYERAFYAEYILIYEIVVIIIRFVRFFLYRRGEGCKSLTNAC